MSPPPAPGEAYPGVAHIGPSVRVSVNVLDRLKGIVSELVSTRNRGLPSTRRGTRAGGEPGADQLGAETLSNITGDLQDAVMSARTEPRSDGLFLTLPRLVRDLALDLAKKIVVTTEGSDTSSTGR